MTTNSDGSSNFPSFGQRAEIFFGARASGRSYMMMSMAPKGATILCRSTEHWNRMIALRNKLNRMDLKVKVLTTPPVGDPPFWPDHETITDLFYQADMRIAELVRVNNKLAARVREVEETNFRQMEHIEDCEGWIKYVAEQPEHEAIKQRAEGSSQAVQEIIEETNTEQD